MAANEISIESVNRGVAKVSSTDRISAIDRASAIDKVSAIDKARRERRRALILPREHGAWGLLLVPMVTGAGVALHRTFHWFPALLLLIAAPALFWLRTPLESLLGTSTMRAQTDDERSAVAAAIAGLAAIALLALGALLWAGRNPYLWLIGVAAGVAFAAQAGLRKLHRRYRMLSEIVGTIGLTSSAAAAYYVIVGKFGATAWMLWLVNLVFAGNQIHYVQMRIHMAKGADFHAKLSQAWAFAIGELIMLSFLIGLCLRSFMPSTALIAFAPILIRGWIYFFQKPAPLKVRKLGWSELAHAIVFCILFIAAISLVPNP